MSALDDHISRLSVGSSQLSPLTADDHEIGALLVGRLIFKLNELEQRLDRFISGFYRLEEEAPLVLSLIDVSRKVAVIEAISHDERYDKAKLKKLVSWARSIIDKRNFCAHGYLARWNGDPAVVQDHAIRTIREKWDGVPLQSLPGTLVQIDEACALADTVIEHMDEWPVALEDRQRALRLVSLDGRNLE